VDTSDQHLVHLPGYCCTELPKSCIYEWHLWLGASNGSSGSPPPPGVTLLHLFLLQNLLHTIVDARGLLSMSPTLVVAALGHATSTPLGARH
jgi:hypothetical protein